MFWFSSSTYPIYIVSFNFFICVDLRTKLASPTAFKFDKSKRGIIETVLGNFREDIILGRKKKRKWQVQHPSRSRKKAGFSIKKVGKRFTCWHACIKRRGGGGREREREVNTWFMLLLFKQNDFTWMRLQIDAGRSSIRLIWKVIQNMKLWAVKKKLRNYNHCTQPKKDKFLTTLQMTMKDDMWNTESRIMPPVCPLKWHSNLRQLDKFISFTTHWRR